MPKNLVIVESPAKARTIEKILGRDFVVEASYGHVRDLPKSKLGVDVDKNFEPQYVIPTKSRKQVTKLKELAAKSDQLFIATDEDREGEAIGWHIAHVLGADEAKLQRVAFHEITEEAIAKAFESPRKINLNLVNAQQARRIVDRLVGYKLSPFLWKKIMRGLSAGRVQSVALRLLAEREREVLAFVPEEYWNIDLKFKTAAGGELPAAVVPEWNNLDKLATQGVADELVAKIQAAADHRVVEVVMEEKTRRPSPPFTTSTLQQAASTSLGFSVKKTMMIAQQLYEGMDVDGTGPKGLITYMRTDSTNLAASAVHTARRWIEQNVGAEYLPASAIFYKTKSRGAQEAHEAIRPSYPDLHPDNIRGKGKVSEDHYKLYRLIWQRLLASQMLPARIATQEVKIDSDGVFSRATGAQVIFAGFAKVLAKWPFQESQLPEIHKDDSLNLLEALPSQHHTEPPARYTEAGLVKKLEQMGIGRPSTYAPTITTLVTRNYVERTRRTLFPQPLGLQVNDFLVEHFPAIVDYNFTAKMEEDLDNIAEGDTEWVPVVENFYRPFIKHLEEKEKDVVKQRPEDEETDQVCPRCGGKLVIKTGRFGKFMACSNFPECRYTAQVNADGKAEDTLTDRKCPECGSPIVKKRGRFGEFFGCSNYPKCKYIEPNKAAELDIACPKCKEGKIVTKRTKRGKVFWGCNRYPDCDFASWDEPVKDKCPSCDGFMTKPAKKGYPVCTSCGYEVKV